MDRIPPGMDTDCAKVAKTLKTLGMTFHPLMLLAKLKPVKTGGRVYESKDAEAVTTPLPIIAWLL